jgi:hypothetical protein
VKNHLILCAAAAVAVGASIAWANPTPVLSPGNPVRAFDSDVATGNSNYPTPNETPPKVIDGLTATKYLNFGNTGSGFIVIPSAFSIIQSFQLTTANDASERDPASFQLFGTNSPIVSADNSNGLAEPWTMISSGALPLPPANSFQTPYAPVNVVNSTSYSAYKLLFPTTRTPNGCCMQVSEAQFYSAPDAAGPGILAPFNNIRAIDDPLGASQSSYPNSPPNVEGPVQAIDANMGTKYLNFGREHSGLIVTPSVSAIVDGIQFTTANDSPSRDPVLISVYGTNDPITGPDNGFGNSENWTLIVANLPYAAPDVRTTVGPLVTFANGTPWTSYKIEVVDNKGPDTATDANSIQFAEVQLFSGSVPEPSTLAVLAASVLGLTLRRRRA